ncbi:MAG: DUF4019 domain-containing protein [Pseudoxanthomonas sp.]
MKTSRFVLLAASLAFAGIAHAQQPAQPAAAPAAAPQQQQITPAQQAQLAKQDAEMTKAAAQVIQLVDQNKTGEVWEGASPVAKAVVTKEAFVQQITADRKTLGALAERKVVGVSRAFYEANNPQGLPAGTYITVAYASKFANAPQPVREIVSFHADDDKTWRVSGYSLR